MTSTATSVGAQALAMRGPIAASMLSGATGARGITLTLRLI